MLQYHSNADWNWHGKCPNSKDYKCKECRIVEKEKSDEWTTKILAIPREVNGVMNIINIG